MSADKDETLAVHSFVTIDYRDAIKWNARNAVRKQPVFAHITYTVFTWLDVAALHNTCL